jgi:transcriptional regulator with XRE-family HTH domain
MYHFLMLIAVLRSALMDYTRLGKRIKEERLRLNLTQEKLSEKVGISTAYLGQIERGERCITLDKLIPLANYLGVTVDFLLTDYIVTDEDNSLNILTQLFRGKTVEEKELAVNMLKLLFSYTDGKI